MERLTAGDNPDSSKKGISTGFLVGVLVGAIIYAVIASVAVTLLIVRRKNRLRRMSGKDLSSKISIKIDGVKEITLKKCQKPPVSLVPQLNLVKEGYGKVYRGVLEDKTLVAVKRAEEGSFQGKHEFLTDTTFVGITSSEYGFTDWTLW